MPLVSLIFVAIMLNPVQPAITDQTDLYRSMSISSECGGGTCQRSEVCDWLAWCAWSQCSESCGGGTRRRDRPLCCRSRWNTAQCIDNCDILVPDGHEIGKCNTDCFNGGNFTGSSCSCPESHFDSCCGQRIQCGHPGHPTNGIVHGSSFYFDDSVTYSCNTNFNLTDGDWRRTCARQSMNQNVGFWTGVQPRCAYVNYCQSVYCENGATCIDLLETYDCFCTHGFSGGHCEFDILPPGVEECPEDRQHRTRQLEAEVAWNAPSFYDPHGSDVEVTMTTNIESPSLLSWGDHDIQFVGTKENNGLSSECIFTESMDPYQCTELTVPANGSVACNGWNERFSRVCAVFCTEGWTFPRGSDTEQLMVCVGSGEWLPRRAEPKCSERVPMTADISASNSFTGDCEAATAQIQEGYIALLTGNRSPFHELCSSFPQECTPENVVVRCP